MALVDEKDEGQGGVQLVERGDERDVVVGREITERRRKKLKNSVVGFLRSDNLSPKDVEEWLTNSWGCLGPVKVISLGKRRVLISFEQEEEADRLQSEMTVSSCSGPLAIAIDWAEIVDMKEVWIRVSGIPLVAWDAEVIEAVGWAVGEDVIEMDANSLSGDFSEHARLKLLFKEGAKRRNSIKLNAENRWYTVLIDWEDEDGAAVARQKQGGEDSSWVGRIVRKMERILKMSLGEDEEKFRRLLRDLEVKKKEACGRQNEGRAQKK